MALRELSRTFPDRITTDRLILRAPNRADVPVLADLANNAKIHAMLARLPHPYGQADAEHFIDVVARSPEEHAYAITTQAGTFLGLCGYHVKPHKAPELGYWLGEPFWGQGYASEVVQALVATARHQRRIDKLEARVIATNPASRRVLEKAGFKQVREAIDACGPHQGVSIIYFERDLRS